jgi:hypothetical protein
LSRVFRKSSVDKNEIDIVNELKKVPGLTVEREKDDLFVGYKGVNYWYECKVSPKSKVKETQYKLAKEWQGHYRFCFSAQDILQDIGIEQISAKRAIFNAVWHGIIYKGLTPALANKNATKAVEQYKSGEYDTLDLLIQSMIEEAGK